jgi:hypothetical protein
MAVPVPPTLREDFLFLSAKPMENATAVRPVAIVEASPDAAPVIVPLSAVPATVERVRYFSSLALARTWAYGNLPALPAIDPAVTADAPTFKRPAYQAPTPYADGPDDIMNGADPEDFATAA